ncbi:MAG: hypothetical protein ACRD3T_21750 [Terriglobia bacterium]
MNALLIYPEWPDTYWSFKHALAFEGKRSGYLPPGVMSITPLLPKHWNKRFVDRNARALTAADLEWADLALLSGCWPTATTCWRSWRVAGRAEWRSRGRVPNAPDGDGTRDAGITREGVNEFSCSGGRSLPWQGPPVSCFQSIRRSPLCSGAGAERRYSSP